jgi:lantibiotic leader peptide-processing serine protease
MASPHVAGVAALIESTGVREARDVQDIVTDTAHPIPCPTAAQLALYAPFPSVNNDAPQCHPSAARRHPGDARHALA